MYFTYDPYDYRIAKYKNGATRQKLYHLEGEHIEAVYEADYNGGSYDNESPVATFLRGVVVDEIVNGYYYDAQGEKTNYTFHHDQLQSLTGLSVQDGEVLERNSYKDFGRFTTEWNGGWFTKSPNIQKFTGREYDEETRLYYYRARYYDPDLGRFMSEDPLGFGAGINFYA